MKWREVKILCAGMCVCTVIAAMNPVRQEELKRQESEMPAIGTEISERSEIENRTGKENEEKDLQAEELQLEEAHAEVERHNVHEVGSGNGMAARIIGEPETTETAENTEAIKNTDTIGSANGNETADEIQASNEEQSAQSNLIIADVTNYVNVRSLPSEEGEILGKLYDDSVGRMHGEENGWYYIESGRVKGYVKGEFVLTGEEAEVRAKEVGTRLAEVITTTLKVRKEATTDSIVLGLVPGGDILNVLEEVEGWVKVEVEDGQGYVSTDYVKVYTENVEAESREEEAARLKKEEEERKRAEEAAREALRKQQAASKPAKKPSSGGSQNTSSNSGSSQSSSSSSNSSSNSGSSSSTSSVGQQIADYAMRFLGNPYVYGGTSLTSGADCSGFVQSVYKHFGISLPRTSGEQGKAGRAVDGLSNAKPGDLVWYSGHIGIYIGNGKVVHASNEKNGIITSNATYRTILGIRRIV